MLEFLVWFVASIYGVVWSLFIYVSVAFFMLFLILLWLLLIASILFSAAVMSCPTEESFTRWLQNYISLSARQQTHALIQLKTFIRSNLPIHRFSIGH